MEKLAAAISLTQLFVNTDDILASEYIIVNVFVAFQIKLKTYSSKICLCLSIAK